MLRNPKRSRRAKHGLSWCAGVGLLLLAGMAVAGVCRPDSSKKPKEAMADQAAPQGMEEVENVTTFRTVTAKPLTPLQKEFAQQLTKITSDIRGQYPEQSVFWPMGAALYHVDGQGKVTVWEYKELSKKGQIVDKGKSEDTVGYGASRIEDAQGSFYLPDGTPLQSYWKNRDAKALGSMKDIRVKIGRSLKKGEQVAVVHRHALPASDDLITRDGKQRSMRLTHYCHSPVKMLVRVDEPNRLGGHALPGGDRIRWKWQYGNQYRQLSITVRPDADVSGPMLVSYRTPRKKRR